MAISVIAHHPNRTVPTVNTASEHRILSGVVECSFKGQSNQDITRDSLSFTIGEVDVGSLATAVMSGIAWPASFGHDGGSTAPLWSVESLEVVGFSNIASGTSIA